MSEIHHMVNTVLKIVMQTSTSFHSIFLKKVIK